MHRMPGHRAAGDTAIVAFQLVGTRTDKVPARDVLYYFSTATLRKYAGLRLSL